MDLLVGPGVLQIGRDADAGRPSADDGDPLRRRDACGILREPAPLGIDGAHEALDDGHAVEPEDGPAIPDGP